MKREIRLTFLRHLAQFYPDLASNPVVGGGIRVSHTYCGLALQEPQNRANVAIASNDSIM
jgi:hypothetical protein